MFSSLGSLNTTHIAKVLINIIVMTVLYSHAFKTHDVAQLSYTQTLGLEIWPGKM